MTLIVIQAKRGDELCEQLSYRRDLEPKEYGAIASYLWERWHGEVDLVRLTGEAAVEADKRMDGFRFLAAYAATPGDGQG